MKQLQGTVERLFFQKSEFCAGLLQEEDTGSYRKFAVRDLVEIGQEVTLLGEWGQFKGKPSFQAVGIVPNLPKGNDTGGLRKWLTINKKFAGVGEVKAGILSDSVESVADFDEKLKTTEGVMILHERTRIPPEVLQIVKREWETDKGMQSALVGLANLGLGPNRIRRVVDILGPNAYEIVRRDPYCLSERVPGIGFKISDEIARIRLGVKPETPARTREALRFVLRQMADDGHTCIEYVDTIREASLLLAVGAYKPSWDNVEEILSNCKGTVTREIDGVRYVQHEQYAQQEDFLSDLFERLKEAVDVPDIDIEEFTADALDAQVNGIFAALERKISVITGSAGTGKTWTINRICEAVESLGKQIILLAPTGKAAERMREVTGRPATTVHRMLWFDGVRFRMTEDKMPQNAVYVVDETSMCNVDLVWQLTSRINFGNCSLIMVGDHHQLPPIGPGCPLQDAIQENLAETTELVTVQRQSGELKENCTRLLDGHVDRPNRDLEADLQNGKLAPWYVIEHQTPQHVLDHILSLYTPDIFMTFGLGLDEVKVLTPLRKKKGGILSLAVLNARIQEVVHERFYDRLVKVSDEDIHPTAGPPALIHDPVIYRKNDYTLGVMNGSTGIVTEINDSEGTAVVNFGTADKPWPVTLSEKHGHWDNLEVAYATTIHQSQGSEFPVSIVVANSTHRYMLHRQLLYTACTRAQRKCVIIGDNAGISYAASNIKPSERQTWLSLSRRTS